MLRSLAVLLIVVGLGVLPATTAEPIGKGILGGTEKDVAAKLGPPDDKATQAFLEWAKEPRAPVVKVLVYSQKGLGEVAIGFDAKGIARTARDAYKGTWPVNAERLCNAIAAGWTPEKDMSKVFPPIGHASVVYQGHRIPGIKIWEISSRGKNEIMPFFTPAGVAKWGMFKHVATCKGRTAYAVADVQAETGREAKFAAFFVADADTYWQWTFDGLFKLFKDGWPKREPKFEPGSNVAVGPEAWEDHFLSQGDGPADPKWVASRLMAAAVIELVKNPAADLAPARLATQIVTERYDQQLTPPLAKLLQSESKDVRDRAASLVVLMDDPMLIDPLIAGLAGKLQIDAAAAILQKATGQNIGPDAAAWKQWLKDNRKALQEGYAQRKSARAGDQAKVAMVATGKYYHLNPGETHAPTCPNLARALQNETLNRVWLTEARQRKLEPCPKCNPVK